MRRSENRASKLFVALLVFLASWVSLCGSVAVADDLHEMEQIDTCYHWLSPDQLKAKVKYAQAHQGQLYFYGGAPIYCWRSPLGAYSRWENRGSELIRIKFKPRIHVVNKERADFHRSMKRTPVVYSNDATWHEYTIAPQAVESWSIYQPRMVDEMKAEMAFYEAGYVSANDVFYPFNNFNLRELKSKLLPVIQAHEDNTPRKHVFGSHPERHFKSNYQMAWQKFAALKRNEFGQIPPAPALEASGLIIVEAILKEIKREKEGEALERRIDLTAQVASVCDGRERCSYDTSSEVDARGESEKILELTWTCIGKPGGVRKHSSRFTRNYYSHSTIRFSCNEDD